MIRRATIRTLIIIAATVLPYLAGAFISAEFNAMRWSVDGRVFFVFAQVILLFVGALIAFIGLEGNDW